MRDRLEPLDGPTAPAMVPLLAQDVGLALYCVNELISRRSEAGVPVPERMRNLGRNLNTRLLTGDMSAAGHEFTSDAARLTQQSLIGTAEAAEILGVTARQVRRLAADLDGQRLGDKLIFDRSIVTEYRQAKEAK